MAQDRQQRMKRGIWVTVATIVAVMVLFFGMFLHKINSPRALSQEELIANRAVVFDTPRKIKSFDLINQDGEPFTNASLQGAWSLIYFGFTHCPDICPMTLTRLDKVKDLLEPEVADQIQVVMVSVDPARDTEEVLNNYMRFFDPEFIGVTGDYMQIIRLTQSANVAFNKVMMDDGYTIDHTGHLVLVNPAGHYHGFFKPPFELAALKLTLQSIVLYGVR